MRRLMKTIHIKKGYLPRLAGVPADTLKPLPPPGRVAACPARIPFIKPRLRVKKGDHVQVGTLLYEDKQDSRFQFLSPGGGRVEDIRLGPRRRVEAIVIALSPDEKRVAFPELSKLQLETISRPDLVERLCTGGIWPLIRALPFRDIADPDTVPPAIFISMDNQEPFQVPADIYLKGNEDLFEFGLHVLKRLSDKIYIAGAKSGRAGQPDAGRWANLTYTGKYPAGDPGVLLYHLKNTPDENNSWFITGQDVLMVARLLKNGRYPTRRVIAVGGSAAGDACHVQTRLGAPIAHLMDPVPDATTTRYVAGGVFHGHTVTPDDFIGLYETALTVLPEGNEKEFLALFNPGWRKPTYSRIYLSALNPADLPANCNRHGDERACIACMHCADVCPVDILPQLAYKAILAGEVEEALAHGLLDCVECGICTCVCPSKIELTETLKTARAAYRKEQRCG
ncbi:MAG: hypothetical protein DSY90_06415 [Deltaproteobacteria bacterium]|nr:MAG: hypothetical protein DSY90_06415 [Deltaproteobacteria bacterium]